MISIITTNGHLKLSEILYTELSSQAAKGTLYVAFGSGKPDSNLNVDTISALINEVTRVQVSPEDIVYLQSIGGTEDVDIVSNTSTKYLRVNAATTEVGSYTEWGLIFNATSAPNSGTLFEYQYASTNDDPVHIGVLTTLDKYFYIQL